MLYEEAGKTCLAAGITPIFATILLMQISYWNWLWKRQGKTDRLFYETEYEQQQLQHEAACKEMARKIPNINSRNGVITPFVASVILKRQRHRYSFNYQSFEDRVHGDEVAAEMCSRFLRRAIEKNREVYYAITESMDKPREEEQARPVTSIPKRSREEEGYESGDGQQSLKQSWKYEREESETPSWGIRRVVF